VGEDGGGEDGIGFCLTSFMKIAIMISNAEGDRIGIKIRAISEKSGRQSSRGTTREYESLSGL